MSQIALSYAPIVRRPIPRWLPWAVFGCMAYAYLPVMAVFGSWFMLWAQIGHPPRVYLDNPTGLADFLFHFAELLFLGALPAFLLSLTLNGVHSFYHQPAGRRVLYWGLFVASWLGCAALLFFDRSGAMEWWLD